MHPISVLFRENSMSLSDEDLLKIKGLFREDFREINSRLGSLETKVGSLETKVAELGTNVAGLEHTTKLFDVRLASLERTTDDRLTNLERTQHVAASAPRYPENRRQVHREYREGYGSVSGKPRAL